MKFMDTFEQYGYLALEFCSNRKQIKDKKAPIGNFIFTSFLKNILITFMFLVPIIEKCLVYFIQNASFR